MKIKTPDGMATLLETYLPTREEKRPYGLPPLVVPNCPAMSRVRSPSGEEREYISKECKICLTND